MFKERNIVKLHHKILDCEVEFSQFYPGKAPIIVHKGIVWLNFDRSIEISNGIVMVFHILVDQAS